MCIDPATITVLSLVGGAISTGMSVMGSIQQGKAAQAQANYQAKISENNAILAQRQADDAIARGKTEEDQHRKQVARMVGAQRAGIAGSGFDVGDETSQDILGDTAALGEFDALTIKNNAAREAWGYQVQGSNYSADAELQRMRGQSAKTASFWSAGSDLLGGASKFATGYGAYRKQFA